MLLPFMFSAEIYTRLPYTIYNRTEIDVYTSHDEAFDGEGTGRKRLPGLIYRSGWA